MPPNSNARRLQAFRDAYKTLFQRVKQTVRMQLGDYGELQAVERQAQSLLEAGEMNFSIFSEAEFDRFVRGIGMMITLLKKMASRSQDPVPGNSIMLKLHRSGKRGRPKVHINQQFLHAAFQHRGASRISKVLKGVSARTIQRRAIEYGLKARGDAVYTIDPSDGSRKYRQPDSRVNNMEDGEIDALVADTLEIFPTFGIRMVAAHLLTLGHSFPYRRVSDSIRRVRGVPGVFGPRRIHRRRYRVNGPNSLWHGDANLKLVFFGFVIQMFVDGYSRLVTGIQVSTNNKAKTVLKLFLNAVKLRGVPSRVRGDHGSENLQVATWMIQHRGPERGSYIFGRSLHNIRVERMWVDVTAGFGSKWKVFLQDLQANHGLDNSNKAHIWLLQYLYLPALNRDAQEWAETWNAHTMSLADQANASPQELYLFGLAEHGERGIAERDELLRSPEEYGIDWTDMEQPAIIKHFLSRNYPQGLRKNAFHPQHPTTFHQLQLQEPKCPISKERIQELSVYLAERCDLQLRAMEERRQWWQTALEFCHNI